MYDERRRRLVEDFVSLNGTIVNCAGGRGYRYRHWLTGEESVAGPDASGCHDPKFAKRHGYLFETPVDRGPGELEVGEPIVAAGRFSHEAAAVDQRTGIVYETEDPGSGVGAGFYRYIPEDPEELTAGGALQMLAIKGRPQVDLRQGQRRGAVLRVEWVDIDDPDPDVVVGQRPAAARSTRAGARAARSSTAWRGAGRTTGRSTSSPRAAATRRTATSTPTASRRASARSGRTGPAAVAATAGRSCSSTSRRRARSSTGPTTSRSRRAAG